MAVESGERRQGRAQNEGIISHQPTKSTEPPPCPRCESTNTKFCYYNNYNLSQPRHFCKSCRRYWTQGGALRDIPVGGGTRKNSKRARSVSSSTSSLSSSVTSSTSTLNPEPLPVPVSAHPEPSLSVTKPEMSDNLNLNENVPVMENRNFFSLLNSQEHAFMGLMSGYGSGFGLGSSEAGAGFGGRGVWSYPTGMGSISGGDGSAVDGGDSSGYNKWHLGDNEGGSADDGGGGLVDGNYFAWPSLSISAPGKEM